MGKAARLPVLGSRQAIYEGLPPRPADFAVGGVPALVDAQGRRYTYLRLSVTDRCDLGCVYCMPPGGEDEHSLREDLLSFEEAARLVRVFGRGGIRRVRLTGGEPLVRKDVVNLVALIAEAGAEEVVLTTNGTRLAELARPLRDAGLAGVNVSVDSLRAERFRRITRGGALEKVLAGVDAALAVGLSVKLNTVALRGENDDELGEIVDFAWARGIVPRFIELMPLGEGAKILNERYMPVTEIVARLGERVAGKLSAGDAGKGPARYLGEGARRVGFITAVSEHFCDTCNRVRVTAKGDIRACLASRRAVSLRDLIRAGMDDLDLSWAIHWSLVGKDAGHYFAEEGVVEHEAVGMSLIGG